MHRLGWSPGAFGAEPSIRVLAATPGEEQKLGSWNLGGDSNAGIDTLRPRGRSVVDDATRREMRHGIAGTPIGETAYAPLYPL